MPSPRLPAPRPVSHTGLRLTGVRPTARLSTLVVAGALALPAVLGAQVRAQPAAAPRAGAPPVAPRVPRTDTAARRRARGRLRVHEDKQDPRVIAYLEAENAYTEAMTAHTAALRDTLYREMLGRLKQTDLSVPYRKDGYWYYTRTEEGKSYPIFCRRAGTMQAPEEVVLDQNARAAGKKYHGLGGLDVSPDGSRLLFLEDTTALRVFTLYVRDLRTGRDLDTVANVVGGTAWANDNRTYFYVTGDSARAATPCGAARPARPRGGDATCSARTRCSTTSGSSARATAVHRRRRRELHDQRLAGDPGRPARRGAAPTAGGATASSTRSTTAGGAGSSAPTPAGRRTSRSSSPRRRPDAARVGRLGAAPRLGVRRVRRPVPRLRRRRRAHGRHAAAARHRAGRRPRAHRRAPRGGVRRVPVGERGVRHAEYRVTYSSLVTPSTVYDYDVRARRLDLRKRTEVPTYDAARYEVRRRRSRRATARRCRCRC
jgi:oligopeptidase B